jgi:hypothetical protein
LIACWRRPDSRFGPLMIAAGFVNFLPELRLNRLEIGYRGPISFVSDRYEKRCVVGPALPSNRTTQYASWQGL